MTATAMWLAVALSVFLAPAPDSPPRYELETLYVIHRSVTAANYQRIETLFSKVYPDFDLARLKPTTEDQKRHYATFGPRLLEESGVRLVDPERAFEIVRDQVDRELKIRAIFKHLLADALQKGSVRAVCDSLVKHDDPKRPVCATERGKGGLLVYVHVTASGEELERLEDNGVRFGAEFRVRVVAASKLDALPALGGPHLLGSVGQGRHIFRLLRVGPDLGVGGK